MTNPYEKLESASEELVPASGELVTALGELRQIYKRRDSLLRALQISIVAGAMGAGILGLSLFASSKPSLLERARSAYSFSTEADKTRCRYIDPSKLEKMLQDAEAGGHPKTMVKCAGKQYLVEKVDRKVVFSAYEGKSR